MLWTTEDGTPRPLVIHVTKGATGKGRGYTEYSLKRADGRTFTVRSFATLNEDGVTYTPPTRPQGFDPAAWSKAMVKVGKGRFQEIRKALVPRVPTAFKGYGSLEVIAGDLYANADYAEYVEPDTAAKAVETDEDAEEIAAFFEDEAVGA